MFPRAGGESDPACSGDYHPLLPDPLLQPPSWKPGEERIMGGRFPALTRGRPGCDPLHRAGQSGEDGIGRSGGEIGNFRQKLHEGMVEGPGLLYVGEMSGRGEHNQP